MKHSFGSLLLKIYAFVFAVFALFFMFGVPPQNTAVAGGLYATYLAWFVLAAVATFGLAFKKPLGSRRFWMAVAPLYFVVLVVYLIFGSASDEAGAEVAATWIDWTIGGTAALALIGSFVTTNAYPYMPFWRKPKAAAENKPEVTEAIVDPKPVEAVTGSPGDPLLATYFKVFIMGFATLGIYYIYWFYRQWRYALGSDGTKTQAIWLAIFGNVTSFWLFKKLKLDDWFLISIFILAINFAGLLPGIFSLIVLLEFIPFLYAQQQINARHKYSNRGVGTYSGREKVIAWVGGIVLGLFWTLAAIGYVFLPEV